MTRFNQLVTAAALSTLALGGLWTILACGAQQQQQQVQYTPAPPPECGKDTDCKGERICCKGSCVSPR
jgi:hypothetical protein